MFKFRQFVYLALRFYVRFVFRDKKVVVFSGVRRSGNHACIDWVANGLLGHAVEWRLTSGKFYTSTDDRIVHLNNVNTLDPFVYIFLVQAAADHIRRADYVLVSLEDYVPGPSDIYSPRGARHVFIIRNVLSTIASRMTWNRKQADIGADYGRMDVSSDLFCVMLKLRSVGGSDTFLWSYDNWLNDPDWRRNFVHDMGLGIDLPSRVSGHGGGSSFLGTSERSATLTENCRWNGVHWPARVLSLLEENHNLLTPEESDFVNSSIKASSVHEA